MGPALNARSRTTFDRMAGTALPRVALVLALLLAPLLVIAALQDRLLYYPSVASVADVLADAQPAGLSAWPSATDFRGLVAHPLNGTARATVVVLHGNAGHAGHRDFYVPLLTRLGVRVILAEYPGYGPRVGQPGEASMVSDAAATVRRAHADFGAPIVLLGESLGAGVAAAVAREAADVVAGVLLATPWDSLASVARHHYRWLPVDLLLRDRYDSGANLASYRGPVSVVVAADDEVVPARFGRALFDALPDGRKQLTVIAGAMHNDWFARTDETWWRAQLDFLLAAR